MKEQKVLIAYSANIGDGIAKYLKDGWLISHVASASDVGQNVMFMVVFEREKEYEKENIALRA